MSICNIIPKVLNTNKELVESKLFSDLWDHYKSTSLFSKAINKTFTVNIPTEVLPSEVINKLYGLDVGDIFTVRYEDTGFNLYQLELDYDVTTPLVITPKGEIDSITQVKTKTIGKLLKSDLSRRNIQTILGLTDYKDETIDTVTARNEAINQYKVANSTSFLNSFGDWKLLHNYKINNLTPYQQSKLHNIYDSDISILEKSLEGKLDINGQPKVEYVLEFKPKAYTDLNIENASLESRYSQVRHFNRLLSKYAIQKIEQKATHISKADIGNLLESELIQLEEQIGEYTDKIGLADNILDEITKDDSYFWKRFVDYFEANYGISLKNESTKNKDIKLIEDETDNIQRSSSWEDSLKISFNKKNSVSNKVKFAISTINNTSEHSVTGLAEPLEISDIWPKIVTSHKFDKRNPEKIIKTLEGLAASYNPAFSELAVKLKNDSELMNAYISAVNLAIHENKGLLIRNYKDLHQVDQVTNNRDTFIEFKIYDKWLNSISGRFRSDEFTKLAEDKDFKNRIISNLNPKTTTVEQVSEILNDHFNINISPVALKKYIEQNKIKSHVERRKTDLFTTIHNVVSDIIDQKQKLNQEYVSDVRGDLLELAYIAAPYSNTKSNPSYFNVTGDREYSFQDHSFVTEFFSSLNNEQDIIDRLSIYTKDPKLQYSNWLWNTAPEGRKANGIFNFKTRDGLKHVLISNPVNMPFVREFSLSLYGGNKDISYGLGNKYNEMLGNNWDLNVFINNLLGSHFMSVSDSGRTFMINSPRIDINETTYVEGKEVNSVEFNEKGDFKSIIVGSNIYNRIANTIKQEISEFVVARDSIFDINPEENTIKVKENIRENKHLLSNPKHIDAEGNILVDNKPTGRVFKFLNLSYVDQGKSIYFHDYVNNLGHNHLFLSEKELHNLISGFVGTALSYNIRDIINHFNPVRKDLYSVYKYFDTTNLTEEEINLKRIENTLIKDEVDFKKKSAEVLINDYVNRVEIDNFFIGNQNEYTGALDRNKRSGASIKNTIRLQHHDVNERGEYTEEIKYTSLVVMDVITKSTILQSLKGIIRQDILDKHNKDITSTDGITVITQNEFIRRMKSAGKYYLYEDLINDLNDESKPFDFTKYNEFIESLKFFMASRELVNSPYPHVKSFQDKNSTFVALNRFKKDTQLADVINMMESNGIDQLLFQSARKVGGNYAIRIDKNGNFILPEKSEISKAIAEHSYKDLGIQVPTRSHIVDQISKVGVQIARLITNGLNFNQSIYNIKDRSYTGQDLFNHYHDVFSSQIEISSIELLTEWGAADNKGNVIKDDQGNIQLDEHKVYEYIKTNLVGDTQNENLIRSIQDDIIKGEPNLPIYASTNYRKFVSTLFAGIKNKVTNQKLPGIHAHLVPEIFLNPSDLLGDKSQKYKNFAESGNIKYIDRVYQEIESGQREDFRLNVDRKTEDGKTIIKAEIILNPWLSNMFAEGDVININSLSEEMRTMVGMRIPTEEKSSMFVVEVVGFGNTGSSQAIFPSDFITKTGWDFDLDSVFLYRRNLKRDKKGNYSIIEYTENTENTRNRYNDYIHEKLHKLEADDMIAKEAIEDAKFVSEIAYREYIQKINSIEGLKVTDLENVFFEHLENQDLDSLTKQFKIFTKELNNSKIRDSYARLDAFDTFIKEELEYVKETINEYETISLQNKYYNLKHDALIHLADVIENLKERYLKITEIKDSEFKAMQKQQREVWDNLKDNIINDYVEVYDLISFDEFKSFPIEKQNTYKARQNEIINIYESILINPEHYDALMRPNTYENIFKIGQDINDLYNKNLGELNSNLYHHESTLRDINMSTRELKGHSVSFDGLLSLLAATGANLNINNGISYKIPIDQLPENLRNKKPEDIKLELLNVIKGDVKIEGNNIVITDSTLGNNRSKTWTDIAGVNIQEQTSETTANILDAVKDLMGFNINKHTLSVFKLLSSQATTFMYDGSPNRFAFAYMFTHQPIIVDLVQRFNREEILSTTPSIYHIINDIRGSYITDLYKNLRDRFVSIVGENEMIKKFDKDIQSDKDIYIDHNNRKGGNYNEFYNTLNEIIAEEGLNYDVKTKTYPFSVDELRQNIVYRNTPVTERSTEQRIPYIINQLQVLNSFHEYYATGNELVNLASALRFDKADTPTFNHATKILQSVNNAILSRHSLKETLAVTAIPSSKQSEILGQFDRYIYPIDKIRYINQLKEKYDIEVPENKFLINDKSLIESVFPSLFNSTERSAYPIIEQFYKSNVDLGLKSLSNLLLFETNTRGTNQGWKSLKNNILSDNNLLGKDKVENTINDHIIAYSVRDLNFIVNPKIDDYGRDKSVAERTRLLNANNKPNVTKALSEVSIDEFKQLGLANKLRLITSDKTLINSLIDDVFNEAHILNLLQIEDSQSNFDNKGYHGIVYKEGDVDLNMTSDSLLGMYLSENEYIRDTAEDLVKYAFIMDGLSFGNNISKLIPARILYDVNANSNIPSEESPGMYANALRQAHSNILNTPMLLDDFRESLHRSNWNNVHLNPIALPRIYINKHGKRIFDTSKPTWTEVETELENSNYNIIVEPTEFVNNSKYDTRDYITKINDQGEKVLYKRYRAHEEFQESVTFYYPISKNLPFEFGETVIEKFKEGILSESEYVRFIDTKHKEGEFSNIIKNRRTGARYIDITTKNTDVLNAVNFSLNDNVGKLSDGSKALTTRTYKIKNGIHPVTDENNQVQDFKIKTTLLGEGQVIGNDIRIIKDGKSIYYSVNDYAKLEGFESWNDLKDRAKTLKRFVEGKDKLFIHDIEVVSDKIQDELSVMRDGLEVDSVEQGNPQYPNKPNFNKLPARSPVSTKTYAGIGSRQTPAEIEPVIKKVAEYLQNLGYVVNTGDASGADAMFVNSVKKSTMFTASDANELTLNIAGEIHPAWNKVANQGKKLHARNTFQIFGRNLDTPVDFVLAWTPDGVSNYKDATIKTGGSGQAIRLASMKNIPVINLANKDWRRQLEGVLKELNLIENKTTLKPFNSAKSKIVNPDNITFTLPDTDTTKSVNTVSIHHGVNILSEVLRNNQDKANTLTRIDSKESHLADMEAKLEEEVKLKTKPKNTIEDLYTAIYINAATVLSAKNDNQLISILRNLEDGDLGVWKGVSPELSDVINSALKRASIRLNNQSKKAYTNLTHEVNELDTGISEAVQIISNESDASIYIADQSLNIRDKFIKSNMSNPIIIDITKNIESQVNQLVKVLPDKPLTLFISGDKYSSIKYEINDVNRYVEKFIDLLNKKHDKIFSIKTIATDGISNALYNVDINKVNFYQTTGEKGGYDLFRTPKTKYYTDISEHRTEGDKNLHNDLKELDTLKRQAVSLENAIVSMNRLHTQMVRQKIPEVPALKEAVESIKQERLYKGIQSLDIASFALGLNHTISFTLAAKSRVQELVDNLKTIDVGKLFNKDSNFQDRSEYVDLFRNAINISNTLAFIDSLSELSGLEETQGVDAETLSDHDLNVAKLKELESSMEGLREDLTLIRERYIWEVVMRWTRNPNYSLSNFAKARSEETGYEVTAADIQNDLYRLFTQNEDISVAMMWADSIFETGITLSDSVLKEYFQSVELRDQKVNEIYDRVVPLIAKHLGLTGDQARRADSRPYARDREALLRRVIDDKSGELLSEYNWPEYHKSMNEMYDKHNALMRDSERLETEAAELEGQKAKQLYDKAGELYYEAKELRKSWYKENTNQDTDQTILSENEQKIVDEFREKATSEEFKQFLSSKRWRRDRETNTVHKVLPSDKFTSKKYKNLSKPDRQFLNEYKSIISDIVGDAYKNFVKPDTFLPVAPQLTNVQALRQLAGIKSIVKDKDYMGVNEEIIYIMENTMMSDIQKFNEIRIRNQKEAESNEEYQQNVVNEINERFKLPEPKKYKSFDDIIKRNKEIREENRQHTINNKSYDPFTIVNQFAMQSYTHWQRRLFESTYKTLLDLIGSDEFKVVKEKKGKDFVDKLRTALSGKKELATVSGKDTRIYQMLKKGYDIINKQDVVETPLDQIMAVIKQYTSMVYMSLNVYGGIKNVTKGLHDMVMEAVSGEFIEGEHLNWGISNYPYHKLVSTIGHEKVNHLETAIIKRFWNMLELKNEKGIRYNDEVQTLHRMLMMHNAAYFANSATEHFMQYGMLLSMMKSHRVVGGMYMSLNEYTGDQRYKILSEILDSKQLSELDKAIDLKARKRENLGSDPEVISDWAYKNLPTEIHKKYIDILEERKGKFKEDFKKHEDIHSQFELVDGRAQLKKDSQLTNEQVKDFERRAHRVNHQLHGIYNRIDQNRIKQSMIGQLLLQFRSWMRPNWNRYMGSRLGRTRFDEGLGTWQKGAYVSLFDFVTKPFKGNNIFFNRAEDITPVEAMKNIMKDYGKLIRQFKYVYRGLPEYEKANIMRALANISMFIGIGALLKLLGMLSAAREEGDEEPIYALALTIYELNMIHSEITQFTVPWGIRGMVSRTKQYVAPSEKVLIDQYKMMQYLFAYPFADEEDRTYQAGVFRGRNKLSVAMQKNTPLIRQYHKAINVPLFTAWYKLHNPYQN